LCTICCNIKIEILPTGAFRVIITTNSDYFT